MPSAQGCHYSSEFTLKDGEYRRVQIESDIALVVGFVVSENQAFTNNSDGLLFGSEADLEPNVRRGLPILFEPNNSVITAFVKNASGVDTKVMIWTAKPGVNSFMDANTHVATRRQDAEQDSGGSDGQRH